MRDPNDPLVLGARRAIAFLRTLPGSGTCMCGDSVDSHDIGSGHGPVDEQLYLIDSIVTELEKGLLQ